MLNKIPNFVQNTPWQEHLWKIPVKDKTVFLTFDDGPTPKVTDIVLDILRDFDAKATFFCLGRNAEHYPQLVEKTIAEGHRIGNHSYSHIKGFKKSVSGYIADVTLADRILKTSIFRPPYGRIRRKQAKEIARKYSIIMWEILSHDYNRKLSPEQCYLNVINNVSPGSIIVFHDSLKASKNVLKALPMTLEKLSEEGYSFSVIPDNY